MGPARGRVRRPHLGHSCARAKGCCPMSTPLKMSTPLNNAAIYVLVTVLAYLATGWAWTIAVGAAVALSAFSRHLYTDKA